MMVEPRFRRARPILPQVAAEAPAPRSFDERLDDLLYEWGDWIRKFTPRSVQRSTGASHIYKDAASGYYDTDDLLMRADPRRLAAVSAAVDDLLREVRVHWQMIHWHYARRFNQHGPAVWRSAAIPAHGSDAYTLLLAQSRDALLPHLNRRRILF